MDHIIRILNQYPALKGLSSLAPIYEVGHRAKIAVQRSGCGCSAGPIYAQHKDTFSRSLNQLGNGDHLLFKQTLGVDQVCFYQRDSAGKNVLRCI